ILDIHNSFTPQALATSTTDTISNDSPPQPTTHLGPYQQQRNQKNNEFHPLRLPLGPLPPPHFQQSQPNHRSQASRRN
ncbi:hypothetical protein NDU88_001957, partial [Pleurodeles waltl]